MKDFVGKAQRLGQQSLKVDQVRSVVATVRYLWFTRVARRMRTLSETDLGNMHELPYPDNSFDVALMSSVLSYSTERERAAGEMLRITKPGGVIGV